MIRAVIRGPAAALSFLTVIPLPRRWSAPEGARPFMFFPAVGFLIGGVLFLADAGLGRLAPLPRALLVVACWLGLTGGLHFDGLIDTGDALAPGLPRDRARAALEDPRAGAMGIAAALVVTGLKWSALAAITAQRGAWLALTPAVARWAVVMVMLVFPYGRGPEGVGAAMSERFGALDGVIASALVAPILLLVDPEIAAGLLAVALAGGLAVAALARRRIGFVSGDTCGAVIESGEALLLLAGCAMTGS